MLKIVHSNIKPKSDKQAKKERIAKFVEILMNEHKNQAHDNKAHTNGRQRKLNNNFR